MVHEEKVRAICSQIKERLQDKQPVHISKGGVSHFVPLPNDPRRRQTVAIDISGLNQILEIDPVRRTCLAEPGVSFATLLKATLAHGLIPAVVPELEGITVGGAVAGCSVESMSYQYGGFHDSALEYEIITGLGDVMTCSPEREPLAFEMIHGSYGTLGVLTRIRFRLLPAKPHVKMTYQKFQTFAAFQSAMLTRCRAKDFDFIDGIIHSKNEFVLCLGQFVESAPYVSNYRWLNIFYKSTLSRKEDYLTTYDYCFRYDTECHWLTKTFPPLEWKPVRLLIGKTALGSTNLIKWSKRLDRFLRLKKRPEVVCDVFIPQNKFEEFYHWYGAAFDFFPLWVIPYRIPKPYGWLSPSLVERMDDELFIDCAVYGKPNSEPDIDYSELLEKKTYELNGIKTLISRNHYTRERFWQIYNLPNYERAKQTLDPQRVFPGLFEKFHRV